MQTEGNKDLQANFNSGWAAIPDNSVSFITKRWHKNHIWTLKKEKSERVKI